MKSIKNISERRIRTGWVGGSAKLRPGLVPLYPNALFKQAKQRVGESPTSHLRWLVVFAQGDRDLMRQNLALGPGSLLAHEVAWIAHVADVAHPGRAVGGFENSAERVVARSAIDPDEVIAAAGEVRRVLSELVTTNTCRFRIPDGLTCTILRGSEQDGKWRKVESFYQSASPLDAIMLCAKSAIEAEGLRLRACAARDCGRLFLKQKRGIFCSAQCSKRETLRKWRENNPEKVREIAKRAYKKRVLPKSSKVDVQVAVGRTSEERAKQRRKDGKKAL